MTEPGFVMGAALTASELEGVAETADWSRWITRGKAPESNDGAGFLSTWNDDVAQLAALGIDEVMITLEWARLWPTAAGPNEAEIEFRRDLLQRITELGMTPWACLVDGSLPGWFTDDERGFADDKARGLIWPRHVDWIGELFGDLVGGWVPMREPRQWAAWGHLVGAAPPGRQRRRDMLKMVTAIDLAETDAARLLRGTSPVATFVTGRTIIGARNDVKAAPHARWLTEHLSSRWLHELEHGRARASFDRVIAQLRPPVVVDADGAWHPLSGGDPVEAVLDGLDAVVDGAGDRTVVAAGDLAGQPAEGAAAFEYLQTMIEGAEDRGATGWWQTSPLDGWHWQHGFDLTPGLIDRDRTPRSAADAISAAASSRHSIPPTPIDGQPPER